MNYFIGSLYGNYDHFRFIVDRLNMKPKDRLWILGNIFDGNDNNPEDCVRILMEILETENIFLLIGEHEFAHIMRYIHETDESKHNMWVNYLRTMKISGEPLCQYFLDDPNQEVGDIFGILIEACEISYVIPIGDYYFYLVSGFPVKHSPKSGQSLYDWQLACVQNTTETADFYPLIMQDPNLDKEVLKQLTPDKTIVICADKNNNHHISFHDHIFTLSSDHINGIEILGIDAAGYFVSTVMYPNSKQ